VEQERVFRNKKMNKEKKRAGGSGCVVLKF
jgi:hypothetical protein